MRTRHLVALTTLLLGSMIISSPSVAEDDAYTTWSDIGGSKSMMQYSALKQIDKQNVSNLELAWTYSAPGPGGRVSFGPIVVDNIMYVQGGADKSGKIKIVALDATTGKEIWLHLVDDTPTYRGFNYWENEDRSDRRLIFAADSYLQQLDARTGELIKSFGNDGRVNLREGLGRDPTNMGQVQSGSPGQVFEDLLILGSAPGEIYNDPPGYLRAYDVRTGELVWTFHTIPQPGEYGYETWPPDAWKYSGGVNAWSDFSIDEKRGIAYFPLGSPTYDLYGADRIGANLFGNSLLALDARTGERIWHFQTLHHDIWDYDLVTGPKLLTVEHEGKMVDVVAQPGKTGFLYVFNRETGEPLWPIEERPVPKTDVPGEQSWPTQPVPTHLPPFGAQTFGVDQINPYLDEADRSEILDVMAKARNEGIFTPPVVDRTQIMIPGAHGVSNFFAAAGDPETGMLYIRAWNGPDTRVLSERGAYSRQAGPPGAALYSQQCFMCHGPDRANMPAPDDVEPDYIKETVRYGMANMPPIPESALSEEDLDTIISYLKNPDGDSSDSEGADQTARVLPPARAPAPPGQTRYWGPYGNRWTLSGLPAIEPPWTELVAYDLNEGTIKWRTPVGTVPALAAQGIKDTGSVGSRAAPVVTAGGLIFIGSSKDGHVYVFDKETGELIWQVQIPGNPDGMPAVYEVDGRQYVAFFAQGGGGNGIDTRETKPEAQGYYVFALPN